jgi:hypothetical protein
MNPGESTMRLITASLKHRAALCNPQEIANAVWVHSVSHYAFTMVCCSTHVSHPTFNCQLVQVWACAKLGFYEASFLETISHETTSRIDEFAQQNLSNVAWSLAKLDHYDEGLMTAITARALTLVHEMDSYNMGHLLWACAHLQHPAPELIAAFEQRYLEVLTSDQPPPPNQIVSVLWGMAVAGALRPELWNASQAALHLADCQELGQESLSSLFQAYMAGVATHGEQQWPMSAELLAAAQDAWREGARHIT